MKRYPRIAPLILAFTLLFAAAAPLRAATDPAATVEAFHAQLITIMKEAKTLQAQGRFDRLAPTMDQTFDLQRMIKVASTPQWASADAAQRTQLFDAFRRLSIATYAAQFDGYSGEKFESVGERPGPQSTVLVETQIVGSNGDKTGLTYVLKKEGEQWLIADILLDNSVSQLAVRRSEYRRILKDSGIAGLIGTLNKKADDLLAK